MDKQNAASSQSNNANAPGTYPTPVAPPASTQRIIAANALASQGISNDKRAPFSSDPLNGGILTSSDPTAEIEIDDELGGTGTIIVQGVLSQADYNPDLSGRERTKVYDKMRKGDATVRLALGAIKYPIFSTNWYIKPGKNGTDTDEITSFIRSELFQNPNFSWTQFMHQAFLFCDYGNSFAEKVFRMRMDGKIGWKKFAPRLPHSVWRYTLQDGITPGITQILPVGGITEIPQEKLLMFVLELEGSNYEGTSLLRPMHKHWFYKDVYYKIDSIASERQGMGVPIIHVPSQATPTDKARAKVIARNMRVNEQAYIDLPDGFTIEYIDTKANGNKKLDEQIAHHDRQILKAAMVQFLDMGAQRSSGSHGLSDNQNDVYVEAEQYLAKIFQEPMNAAIKELVDYNFSTKRLQPDEYPTLEYGSIGKVNLLELSNAMKNFVESGIILPDQDLERHIRQTADLPSVMGSSVDNNVDWQTRLLKVPNITPTSTDSANPIKPTRYVNKEEMGINEFKETFMELKEELEQLIMLREKHVD